MDRATYQEAIKKFIYVDGDKAQDYISLQLVSEVGELLGGYAKRLVGRDISDEYLALEAGDICFFLAWISNIEGIYFDMLSPRISDSHKEWCGAAEDLADAAACVIYYAFNSAYRRGESLIEALEVMLGWVLLLIPSEKPLEEILQMNIDKLEVRHGTPA